MKELIIINGAKGSGKTTLAKQMAHWNSILCDSLEDFEKDISEKIQPICAIIDGFDKNDIAKLKEIITRRDEVDIKLILVTNNFTLKDVGLRHFDYYKEITCYKSNK